MRRGWRRNWLAVLALGFAFLYLPILLVVLFSFNDNRLVTVWSGFSLRWYGELIQNERILSAARLSIVVAAVSATIAAVLGTLAALVLVRFGRFRGRLVFGAMLGAPLVMPEVITGLSLLLLFVALDAATGWPGERGLATIIIAHATFATAYVAVIVRARLAEIDRSLEEAAADLGATPLTIFRCITLPLIFPALVAGWLLAFTLSLDDLVIATFVTGPGATTLPMLIFSSMRLGLSPQINALASILIFIAIVGVLICAWLTYWQGFVRQNGRG
jgi:putrescine transport system permease protein